MGTRDSMSTLLFEKSARWRQYVAASRNRRVFWGSGVVITGACLALGLAGLSVHDKYGLSDEQMEKMKRSDPNNGRVRNLGRMKLQQMFDEVPEANRPHASDERRKT